MSNRAFTLSGISRSFGAVLANSKVDLVVETGTVHAVVGENGAGKSTLMKIAYGQIRADEGSIKIKGEAIARTKHSPSQAIARGVGMVHQHFMLVAPLTVTENVILGREPVKGVFVDIDKAAGELSELSKRFGLDVNPHSPIEDLSVGEQQRVEILKVLWQGCDVLILDEPTAVLTPGEVDQLFDVLRELVANGMTVVMITHKLDEVVAIADRITVMRRGVVVEELSGKGSSAESIARAMVGRPVLLEVDKAPAEPGKLVLKIDDLRVAAQRGGDAVKGISLDVRAGEIVGIAGVTGNGQSELLDAIVGLRRIGAGSIRIGNRDVGALSVRERFEAGLSHIPEDRHHRGLVLSFSVEDNLILGRHHGFGGLLGLDRNKIRREAEQLIKEVDIRPDDPQAIAAALSGGNQQKIVVARELAREGAVLLVCAQPTRGVDIGAIELIHKRIIAARDAGLAVLLVSAELSELIALSDRLAVMYGGEIVEMLEADQLAADGARARIGELMTGARAAQGADS